MNDFQVENHGSIFLLRPMTMAGRNWCKEWLPYDTQRFGAAYVVEHRYIGSIVEGISADGLEVA